MQIKIEGTGGVVLKNTRPPAQPQTVISALEKKIRNLPYAVGNF